MSRAVISHGRWVGTFVAVTGLVLPPAGIAGEDRPATLGTKELKQRLIEANARVRAWYVEYESERQLSTGQPAESYLHRVVAAKAPDSFFHWGSHGTAGLDWRDDPLQQRLVLTSSMAVAERPLHRSFHSLSLAPHSPLPGSAPGEFLFLALGWWQFDKRPPPAMLGDVYSVFPAIARTPRYVANPRQELVHGRWCHILENPGRDKLWLDCQRNCAILARELFDVQTGLLAERIESNGHWEVQPGTWAPSEFRNRLVDPTATPPNGANGVKTVDSVLKVLQVRLNDQVSDDLFRFEPLPGSIELDEDGQLKQELPGSADYMESVVGWTQRHYRFSALPVPDSGSATEAGIEAAILAGGIAVLFGLFVRRCRRPGNMPRTHAT